MSQEQTQDTEKKNKRVRKLPDRRKKGDETQTSIRLGHELFNEILDIAESSRLTFVDAERQLIYMGLREYELNRIAGRNKKDIEADYNKRLAEAQAIAAERERRKNSKKSDTITAVTPMLFNGKDENEQ